MALEVRYHVLLLITILFLTNRLIGGVPSDRQDTTRVHALIDTAKRHFKKNNDSLGFVYLKKSYELSEKLKYNRGLVKYWDTKGYLHRNRSEYRDALDAHFQALRLAEKIDYWQYLPRINNNLGVVYRRLDEYEHGVDYHLRALKYAEKINDEQSIMYAENSLGNIYNLMGQYDKAMIYFEKALERSFRSGNKLSKAINYNNIGEVYEKQKKYDDALKYYFKSLEINSEIKSKKGVAICYDCIGSIYYYQDQLKKSIEYFLKALELDEEIGDDRFVAVSDINIGRAYFELNIFDKANYHLKRGLEKSKEIGAKSGVRDAFFYLSKLAEKENQYQKSLEYYRLFTHYKDSILNEENSKVVNKLQVLYDTEKQRKEIEHLEQQKEQREKASRRKTYFIGVLAIAFALVGILAFILYRTSRIKQRTNEKLIRQSNEISSKNEELEKQKKQLEVTNLKITDSLLYAEKIQQALLPKFDTLNRLFADYFVFYKPLSVVSGDFYWVSEHDNKVIVAAVDCTGHGVPGAMMSMLGNSYLNEAIRMPHVDSAAKILDQMRRMIIDSLHQTGLVGEPRDGMDMAVCVYNTNRQQLEYAGAHNPLWVLKVHEFRKPEIREIKGDPMPVSFSRKMTSFTNHIVDYSEGDTIYMFSDGFMDQFGGQTGKRFKKRPFKELLLRNANHPLSRQKKIIERTFEDWRKSHEQIDDVLVMGLRFR